MSIIKLPTCKTKPPINEGSILQSNLILFLTLDEISLYKSIISLSSSLFADIIFIDNSPFFVEIKLRNFSEI